MTLETLTASRLKAFRQCARFHKYRYVDCRVPLITPAPARFGTLMHAALEAWWRAYDVQEEARLLAALGAIYEHLAEALTDEDGDERIVAEELMRGYHVRWRHERLLTLHAEHEFDIPLVNPATGRASKTFLIRGKIDACVRNIDDGRAYLVEHKTTSAEISEGSAYWRRLRLDGQVSLYYSAFEGVAGCIYDVIRRPLQRRLKATAEASKKYTKEGKLYSAQRAEAETDDAFRARLRGHISADPDAYYKRGVVVRLDKEIREHQFDVWQLAQTMREMANEDLHPRNPDACFHYGRPCEYFEVCSGEASLDDPRLFQIRRAHAELSVTDEEKPNEP